MLEDFSMFFARLISLSDGQSYENAQICEETDLVKHNIPMIFENWTGCIFANGKCVIVHHWKIKVIHLNDRLRAGSNAIQAERLILDGNIIYPQPLIIHHDNYQRLGIPEFFIKRGGIAGQLAWTSHQGTFFTHDTNVTSIIVSDPRKKGITSAAQPGIDSVTPTQVLRAAAAPDTVHGKVTPRKQG
jgi:hypothetical protein